MPRLDTITFLSDYGLQDEFVGVVKGVLRSLAPHAFVLDLTHDIAPHDVRAGALTLARSVQYVPPGVVLAIVDPGVGSERRAVAVEVGDEQRAYLVGPDNGLLAPAVAMVGGARRAVSLTNTALHLETPGAGATFAGRDVFAPAAAHLANGGELDELGEPIDPLGLLPGLMPLTRVEDGALVGEVLWVDRFGNVQLNVDPDEIVGMGERITLQWKDQSRVARRADHYAALGAGEVGLVVDSYGLVSIAVDRGSAADTLRLQVGDAVTLREPR